MLDLDTPTAAYRAAAEAHDVDGMLACMAPGVVLASPITDAFSFEGREQMRVLLEDVFAVMEDVRYSVDAGDARTRLLRLSGRIGGQRLDEAMVVWLDDDGLIERLELYVRPLPGLTAMAAALGPRVAARHSRPRALVVRAMMAPLALMTRRGEGLGARLARP
jgi:hypothetical protein